MASTAPRVLVTGMFRGGLGYARELLLRAGFIVGDTFDSDTSEANLGERLQRCAPVEVSPFVVPYLADSRFDDTRIVYVLRNPTHVIGSLLHFGYPHEAKGPHAAWYAYASRHLNNYAAKFGGEDKAPEAALSLTHNWLQLTQILRPNLRMAQLEAGPRALLTAAMDWEPGRRIVYCPTDINASDWVRNPAELSSDPHAFQLELDALMHKHGYYERRTSPRGGHAHYTGAAFHC